MSIDEFRWGYNKAMKENTETINGLKRAMEVMESALEVKDQKIKTLEYEIIGLRKALSDAGWALDNARQDAIEHRGTEEW